MASGTTWARLALRDGRDAVRTGSCLLLLNLDLPSGLEECVVKPPDDDGDRQREECERGDRLLRLDDLELQDLRWWYAAALRRLT